MINIKNQLQNQKSTFSNLHNLLESEYLDRLNWDAHKCEILLDKQPIKTGKLRVEIEKETGLAPSKQDIQDLIYEFAWKNPYSEVANYLNNVYKRYERDGSKSLIKKLARDVLKVQTELEETYVIKFLVGAVARALEPGCKLDTALILAGKQGYGKTTFFETLAHPSRFVTISHSASQEKVIKDSYKYWIVEYGELDSKLSYNNMNHLKNYMSMRSDEVRHLYVNMSETKARHFVIVGTTNKDNFLIDPTGNRRFWVVKITNPINIKWVEENRDLLWASAIDLYLQGYSWYLTPEEQELSNHLNSDYDVKDVWENDVLNWIATQTEPFTISDVLFKALDIPKSKQNRVHQLRVSTILTQAGYIKGRNKPLGKERGYYWTKE
jgi:predicted P-loop ATPase